VTAVAENGPVQNPPPGMPCPNCRSRIEFSIQTLIISPSIRCPSCGLELTVDPEGSEAALDALRRYAAELESIRRDQASGG
jgi:DNA-directed RNA polymerase subunit RPC12/RpoP